LSAPSLWLDEGSTWAITGHSFADLVRALRHSEGDAGALYLIVEHFWLSVWGTSAAALRSLSVVAAVVTVPLFFGVASRLLGRTAALVTTALLAFNPFFLVYARDARMYTLALALSVAATYCFIRLVENPSERRWVVLYPCLASAAIHAHAFALLIVVAHAASLLTLPRCRIAVKPIATAFGIIAASTVPLFVYVVATGGRGVGWVGGLKFGQLEQFAHDQTGAPTLLAPLIAIAVIAGVVSIGVVTATRTGRSDELWRGILPPLLWLLPVVATVVVSIFKPFFVSRYLFVSLPGYVLCLGVLVEHVARRARRVHLAVPAALVLLAVPAIPRIWRNGPVAENWRGAETYVAAAYRPGDSIVVPLCHVHAFGYYASRDPRLAHVRPTWDYPRGTWTVAYWPAHRPHLRAIADATHTTWIVLRRPHPDQALAHSWRSPALDTLRTTMRRDLDDATTRRFAGIVVYRYAPQIDLAKRAPFGVPSAPA
jgi:mannosyltransferase